MGLGDYIAPSTPTGGGDPKPGGLGKYVEQSGQHAGGTQLANATNFKIDDYSPWMPNGVNSKFNMDLKRAQNQGFWESSAKRLGNLIPNIAGGLVESIGFLGSLASEWGDDRDYNNSLTEFGNSMKNPFGTVYREHPEKTWDLSDPAWWGDASMSLVESASSFAILGAGMSTVLRGITSLAKAAGAGKTILQGTRAANQLLTSATLAYTEGAQIGAQVFDDTYNAQLQKMLAAGDDYETAKGKARHIASNAAAATVQINTAVNTVLNIPELAPLFRHEDDILSWWKKAGKRQAGESYDDWATRIKSLDPNGVSDIRKLIDPRHAGYTHYAVTSASEGLEELNNNFAEARGRARGKEGRELRGIGDLLGDAEHYFNDVLNSEGALSFVLGAIGGIAQPMILDNIPIHSVSIDENGNTSTRAYDGAPTEDGKYAKKIVSSKYLTATGHRKYFDNVKDKVVEDINRVSEIKDNIAKAVEKGDHLEASRLKHQLFDVGALNSVQLGIGDAFAAQFESIKNLDNEKDLSEPMLAQVAQLNQAIAQEPDELKKKELTQQKEALLAEAMKMTGVTEAMQKGYTKSKKDNEYKKVAENAQRDVEEYTKLWDDISRKYRSGEEWDSRYADYLFWKEIDVKRRNRIIENEEKRLQEIEARRAPTAGDVDPVTKQSIESIVTDNTAREELLKEEARIRRSLKTLAGTDEVEKANARLHLRNLADKYGVTLGNDEDLIPGAHQVLSHIKDRTDELYESTTDAALGLEASSGFQKWKEKHPNAKAPLVEYLEFAGKRTREDEVFAQDKQRLATYREQTLAAAKNLGDLRTSKGRKSYIKQARATHNALAKKVKEQLDANNTAALIEMYNKKNVADLTNIQRKQYAKMLQDKIDKKKAELTEQQAYLTQLRKDLAEVTKEGFLKVLVKDTLGTGRREIAKVEQKIENLQKDIAQLEARLEVVQDPSFATEEVLPEAKPAPSELTDFTDVAMAEFMGDRNAFDDLLDRIWAMKLTGPLEVVLDSAYSIMGEVMDLVDHPYLYQDEGTREKSLPMIKNWLTKTLQDAGKVKESTPLQDSSVMGYIATLGLEQKEASDLAAYIDETISVLLENKNDTIPDSVIKEFVQGFGLSQAQAIQLLDASRAEYEKMKSDLNKADEVIHETKEEQKLEETTESTTEEAPSTDQLPEAPPPDTNIGQPLNFAPDLLVRMDGMDHAGLKVERAIKANVLTHEYFEEIQADQNERTRNGVVAIGPQTGSYVKRDRYSLNPRLNPLYVRPGYIAEGTELTLAIDQDWNGTRNNDDHFVYGGPQQLEDSFSRYVDEAGNIAIPLAKLTGAEPLTPEEESFLGNVPIKIVDPGSNTTVAYLPRLDWISARYEGASDYRNVVDEKYDNEGNLVYGDNVAAQRREVLDLRRKIVFAFNQGMKRGLPTTVTSRSRGIAARVEVGKASELLPDPSLRFAMVSQLTAFTGRNEPATGVVIPPYITEGGRYFNVPGVLLPDAAGRLNFEPVWTERLGKAETDTVIRAIEVYLTHNTNASEEVLDRAQAHADYINTATGYDITTPEGLQGFINQYYYYTRSFDDQMMAANRQVLGQTARVPEFMLSVARTTPRANGKAPIKAGVSFLGRISYATVDQNGIINEQFRAMLEDHFSGMQSRFRNVVYTNPEMGVRGINSTGSITEVVFHPEDDNFSATDHPSYNDMIKQYTNTTMYGKLRSTSGDYVYYAHPVTELDKRQVMDAEVFPARRTEARPTEPTATPEFDPNTLSEAERQALADLDTNIDFGHQPMLNVVPGSSVGTVAGVPISLESLQELHTFTSVEHRNGLTPAEVLQDLKRLGISSLPKGYNPFYTC